MVNIKYNIKGHRNQDLIAAREQLKQFRRDVSQLKKKGLLDKKYDARSVNPSKYLKSVIKQFQNVLSGEAQTVKIKSKEKQKYYKEKGYGLKGNRVIVPTLKNEKAYVRNNKIIVKTQGTNGSIVATPLELDRHKINEWPDLLRKKYGKLKPDEQLSFTLFGNPSLSTGFQNVEQMIEYLMEYPTYEKAKESNNYEGLADFVENVVVYKIVRDPDFRIPKSPFAKERTEDLKRRSRERYDRKLNRMTPIQEERYHAEKALRERERRAREKIYRDPVLLDKQKEAAKIRAKKSREKRGKKSG